METKKQAKAANKQWYHSHFKTGRKPRSRYWQRGSKIGGKIPK